GDPYQREIEECTKLIMEALGRPNDYTLAYQSRVGPVEWLQPYTEDSLIALGEKGVKDLVVIPISFVSEHIETLQEIDIEYRG
ncbi:ferrochelatase, partial [Streptococcus pyogenes]